MVGAESSLVEALDPLDKQVFCLGHLISKDKPTELTHHSCDSMEEDTSITYVSGFSPGGIDAAAKCLDP